VSYHNFYPLKAASKTIQCNVFTGIGNRTLSEFVNKNEMVTQSLFLCE
jgi:hypothetical protein